MSGTTDPPRPPNDNAEWARAAEARIAALENPSSQRIGSWVLSTSAQGHLIASHVEGGSVTLAKRPSVGENDPDEIVDSAIPSMCAMRSAAYTIPAGGAAVRFDGTRGQNGGDWTGGKADYDAVIVPVAGTYYVAGAIHFATNPDSNIGAAIRVNGTYMAASSQFYDRTAFVDSLLDLNSGDALSLFAFASNGTAVSIGSSTLWPGGVPTTMSAFLINRKE